MARIDTLAVTLALAVVTIGLPAPAMETATSGEPPRPRSATGSFPLSSEQDRLIAWAEGRFAAAGLELPALEYVFHDDLMICKGHLGQYNPYEDRVEMCSMHAGTLLHEIAHVWVDANLNAEEEEAFMLSRGLEVWGDHGVPWSQRGSSTPPK